MKDEGTYARARGEAALALGEIGDPAASPALVARSASRARPSATSTEMNRHVADALGALRAREAVPALTKLLQESRDGFTQVAAVDALGHIGDPAAVDTLVAVATGDGVEPFTARKALLALGRIGDAARERGRAAACSSRSGPGVSFFPEAAFAAVQIGRPMAAPLLAVLEGKDERARGMGARSAASCRARSTRSRRSSSATWAAPTRCPPWSASSATRTPDPGIATYVRVFAAESLGRMRAREAVRPLGDLVARERDADVRDRYCDALARIGDPAALPALKAAAGAPTWDLREGPLTALSRLGGEAERPFIEQARARDCAAKCAPPVEAAYAGDGRAARRREGLPRRRVLGGQARRRERARCAIAPRSRSVAPAAPRRRRPSATPSCGR